MSPVVASLFLVPPKQSFHEISQCQTLTLHPLVLRVQSAYAETYRRQLRDMEDKD